MRRKGETWKERQSNNPRAGARATYIVKCQWLVGLRLEKILIKGLGVVRIGARMTFFPTIADIKFVKLAYVTLSSSLKRRGALHSFTQHSASAEALRTLGITPCPQARQR